MFDLVLCSQEDFLAAVTMVTMVINLIVYLDGLHNKFVKFIVKL
jgi:hypothetical protein